MANYAVRIYDLELKTWLIAEAERRGAGVRTSDVVEEALRRLRDGSVTTAPVEHAGPTADAVRAAYRAVLYDEVPQHTADDLIEAAEARVGKTGSVAHVTGSKRASIAFRRRAGGSDARVDEVPAVEDLNAFEVGRVEPSAVRQSRATGPRAVDPVLHDAAAETAESDESVERGVESVQVQRVKGPDSGPSDDLGF